MVYERLPHSLIKYEVAVRNPPPPLSLSSTPFNRQICENQFWEGTQESIENNGEGAELRKVENNGEGAELRKVENNGKVVELRKVENKDEVGELRQMILKRTVSRD